MRAWGARPCGGQGKLSFLSRRGRWSRWLSGKMNFLRGVMGGQSAGPQHTEAETVRGAAGPGLGKGPGRNWDGGLGGPEVTSRASLGRESKRLLPLCPRAFLRLLKPASYFLTPPAKPPARRLGPADNSSAGRLVVVRGWCRPGSHRSGAAVARAVSHAPRGRGPVPPVSPVSTLAVRKVQLPPSRSGMGLWGRRQEGLKPSC